MKTVKHYLLFVAAMIIFGIPGDAQTVQPMSPDLSEEAVLVEKIKKANATMAFCGFVPDNADCKGTDPAVAYRKLLNEAATKPQVLLALATASIQTFESFGLRQKSAPQATQVAVELNAELMKVIVIQNQRIIELLEAIAKKK